MNGPTKSIHGIMAPDLIYHIQSTNPMSYCSKHTKFQLAGEQWREHGRLLLSRAYARASLISVKVVVMLFSLRLF
jgi:hypothetical protein